LFDTNEDTNESSIETVNQSPGFVPLPDLDTLPDDNSILLVDLGMDPTRNERYSMCDTARVEQVTNEVTIILPDLDPLLPQPEDSQIAKGSQEQEQQNDLVVAKPAAAASVEDSHAETECEDNSTGDHSIRMEKNTTESIIWTRHHDTLLTHLMLEKLITKRRKRRTRCRQCGHFVKDPIWKYFHRYPGYKVGQARPRSCTVAPSQRKEGFPVPPGKRVPPILRVQLSEILKYL